MLKLHVNYTYMAIILYYIVKKNIILIENIKSNGRN